MMLELRRLMSWIVDALVPERRLERKCEQIRVMLQEENQITERRVRHDHS